MATLDETLEMLSRRSLLDRLKSLSTDDGSIELYPPTVDKAPSVGDEPVRPSSAERASSLRNELRAFLPNAILPEFEDGT